MTTFLLLLLALTFGIEESTNPVVGIAALHVESGRTVNLREHERFPMGSVFKFPLTLYALRQVDAGKLRMDERVTIPPEKFSPGHSPIRDGAKGKPVTLTVRELLRATLGNSDNTAADYFLDRFGGGKVVTKFLRESGIDGISIDRTEREIIGELRLPGGHAKYAVDPRDTATPAALVKLLLKFHRRELGLSQPSHDFAVKAMIDTPSGHKRIRAGIPKGATVAHKTGTMPGTLNDAGLVTSADGKDHLIVVVLTKASTKESSRDEREKIVADATRKIYAELVR